MSPTATQQYQTSKKGTAKQVRSAKRWEDDLYLQSNRSNRDDNDLTSDTTWLTTADDSLKWDAVNSDFISSRFKQPARLTTPITATTTTQPTTHDQPADATKTHYRNEEGHQRRRRTRGRRCATRPLSNNRQLNLHYTKAATSSALVQTATTRSLMTRTHTEWNTSPSRRRYKITSFQAARDLSGTPCSIHLFALSEFPSPTREGPRTKPSDPEGKCALCSQGVDSKSDHGHCHCGCFKTFFLVCKKNKFHSQVFDLRGPCRERWWGGNEGFFFDKEP